MADESRHNACQCQTNLTVLEACLRHVSNATKVITKENIGEVEKILENDKEMVIIEKSLKKLLDIGMKIEHAHHHVSKILDEIQPGMICLLKQVIAHSAVLPYLLPLPLLMEFRGRGGWPEKCRGG